MGRKICSLLLLFLIFPTLAYSPGETVKEEQASTFHSNPPSCRAIALSESEVLRIWNAVFTPQGVFSPKKVEPKEQPEKLPEFQVRETVVTDENGGKVVENPKQYIPSDVYTKFLGGKALTGRWHLEIITDYTTRVGRPSREMDSSKGGLLDIYTMPREELAQLLGELRNVPLGELFYRALPDPTRMRNIKNWIAVRNFQAKGVCGAVADSECESWIYSAYAKYFASALGWFDVFSVVWHHPWARTCLAGIKKKTWEKWLAECESQPDSWKCKFINALEDKLLKKFNIGKLYRQAMQLRFGKEAEKKLENAIDKLAEKVGEVEKPEEFLEKAFEEAKEDLVVTSRLAKDKDWFRKKLFTGLDMEAQKIQGLLSENKRWKALFPKFTKDILSKDWIHCERAPVGPIPQSCRIDEGVLEEIFRSLDEKRLLAICNDVAFRSIRPNNRGSLNLENVGNSFAYYMFLEKATQILGPHNTQARELARQALFKLSGFCHDQRVEINPDTFQKVLGSLVDELASKIVSEADKRMLAGRVSYTEMALMKVWDVLWGQKKKFTEEGLKGVFGNIALPVISWLGAPLLVGLGRLAQRPIAIAHNFQSEKRIQSVELATGEETIYSDAFVDVFANAYSNLEDVFGIGSRLWTGALVYGAANFIGLFTQKPPYEVADKIVGAISELSMGKPETAGATTLHGRSRNFVNDIVVLLKVDDPSSTLQMSSKTPITFSFAGGSGSASFFEHAPKSKPRRMIFFAHHTDLEVKDPAGSLVSISIGRVKPEETCQESCVKLPWIKDWDPRAKAWAIGVLSAIANFAANTVIISVPGPGTFLWPVIQALIFFPLQGNCSSCIDTTFGYYVHIYTPPTPDENDEIKDMMERVTKAVRSSAPALLKKLTEEAQKAGLLEYSESMTQLNFLLEGISDGRLEAKGVVYFWTKDSVLQDLMEGTGSYVLKDEKLGQSITVDQEKGEIRVDGKVLVDKNELVGLTRMDLTIPAVVIPQEVKRYCVLGQDKPLFSIGPSGLQFNDPNMEDCFYSLNSVSSELLKGKEGAAKLAILRVSERKPGKVTQTIPGEGYIVFSNGGAIFMAKGRREELKTEGGEVRITVFASGRVKFGEKELGFLKAVVFENAALVRKGNCYYFWLFTPAKVPAEFVENITMKPTNLKVDEEPCEFPAFEIAFKGSHPLVKEFNQMIQKVGPVTILETEDKIFYFYAKEIDGVCRRFMRVYDKKTGAVREYEISNIQETPEGIKITDSDGRTHTLDLKVEDGRPILYFNGEPALLTKLGGLGGWLVYDPESGMWKLINGQLIPLSDLFKQNGLAVYAEDNKIKGEPAQSLFFIPYLQGGPGFAIPLVGKEIILVLIAAAVVLLTVKR